MRSLILSLALLAMLPAAAEEEAAEEQAPEQFEPVPPPPDIPNPLESGQPIEPEVTIIRRPDAVIEEYRVNGRMFMMKVTPKVGPAYYLVDRDGDGRMEARMTSLKDDFVVPQWVIFSW